MHYHFSNAQFLIGALTLVLVIIFSVAAFLELRRKRNPPFMSFSDSDYDREFLKYTAISDDEDALCDRRPAFLSFHFRSFEVDELTGSVRTETQLDHE